MNDGSAFIASTGFLDAMLRQAAARYPFIDSPSITRPAPGWLNLAFSIRERELDRWLKDVMKMGRFKRAAAWLVPSRWSIDVRRISFDRLTGTLILRYQFTQAGGAGVRFLHAAYHHLASSRSFGVGSGVRLGESRIIVELNPLAGKTLDALGVAVEDILLAESDARGLVVDLGVRQAPRRESPS